MKKRWLLIFGFIAFACGYATQVFAEGRKVLQLSGKIADKYPIQMTLNIEDDAVFGFYYYKKHKSKILLTGKMDGTNLKLSESSNLDEELQIGFDGELRKGLFFGDWVDKLKDKRFKFSLDVETENVLRVSSIIKNAEGTYISKFNSESNETSLKLNFIFDDWFAFECVTATASGCTGYLKGLIQISTNGKGLYAGGEECEELTINLKQNGARVSEKDCSYYHGMNCDFSGEYIKK